MLGDYEAFASSIARAPLTPFAYRHPLATLRTLAAVARRARAVHADVILSSHLGYLAHAAATRTLLGTPACFHLGLPGPGGRPGHKGAWMYSRIGAGVAPSLHTLRSWRDSGWPAAALHHVPNWVDASRFIPVPDRRTLRTRLGLVADGPIVVFVGRICEQKGIGSLLEAWPAVRARVPGAQLVLVGGLAPGYADVFGELLAAMPAGDRAAVDVRPPVDRPEEFYAVADVVCAPSVQAEAFGLAVVEAMACGVPVVATDLGVTAELLGDEGAALLVPAGEVGALADRLAEWLAHPDAAAVGMKLRARVQRMHPIGAGVDAYEGILRTLARSKPAPAGGLG